MKLQQTKYTKTLAFKPQTVENNPKEIYDIQNTEED
jgi:5-formyltetrahydrofolate cyclo-ligase